MFLIAVLLPVFIGCGDDGEAADATTTTAVASEAQR